MYEKKYVVIYKSFKSTYIFKYLIHITQGLSSDKETLNFGFSTLSTQCPCLSCNKIYFIIWLEFFLNTAITWKVAHPFYMNVLRLFMKYMNEKRTDNYSSVYGIYRKRLLISARFSYAYTSLFYREHASKKACAYKQAFTVKYFPFK